ncbi:hypothetical protein, partial [Duffyella gerundensis]|uniref:hypothetical protein n=1 Tax=Duffyella gerundensis TaxID=1619313 RepID=UPI001CA388A4
MNTLRKPDHVTGRAAEIQMGVPTAADAPFPASIESRLPLENNRGDFCKFLGEALNESLYEGAGTRRDR